MKGRKDVILEGPKDIMQLVCTQQESCTLEASNWLSYIMAGTQEDNGKTKDLRNLEVGF